MQAVNAVKRHLASRGKWLLILDNADDIAMVRSFIPERNGHVLLTTRAHALGATAKCIDVKEMNPEEATELLLRRAKIEDSSDSDHNAACEIATKLLDGLPLALDQAGAYIEETGCGLTRYIEVYRKHASELLKRRGASAYDHPDPVATTWALSFENIEKANGDAADLLRLCAFLAPDAIPEEILQTQLPDGFALDRALAEILKYSLISRDTNAKTIEIHRLVQKALQDAMTAEQQRLWADRAVRAVDDLFPQTDFRYWPVCERLLPQALQCAELISQHNLEFEGAARLLNQAAGYLWRRARYAEAEPLYQRSLTICEKALGSDHPYVAISLNNLAELYRERGEYDKAEPLYQRALAIREKALGPDHPDVAQSLNNLAALYYSRGDYDKAEPLYQRALAIREKALGPNHPDVASSLNNLALLYNSRGDYDKAEPLYQRALAIREKALGPDHPDVATSLNNLAGLYYGRGEYDKAEPLLQRSLAINEKALGPDHPLTASTLESYAALLEALNQPEKAAELRNRAAAIRAKFARTVGTST